MFQIKKKQKKKNPKNNNNNKTLQLIQSQMKWPQPKKQHTGIS